METFSANNRDHSGVFMLEQKNEDMFVGTFLKYADFVVTNIKGMVSFSILFENTEKKLHLNSHKRINNITFGEAIIITNGMIVNLNDSESQDKLAYLKVTYNKNHIIEAGLYTKDDVIFEEFGIIDFRLYAEFFHECA